MGVSEQTEEKGKRRKERHKFEFLVLAFMSSAHGRLVLVVSGIFNFGIGLHAHTHTLTTLRGPSIHESCKTIQGNGTGGREDEGGPRFAIG